MDEYRVLIADDSPKVRPLIKKEFEEWGFVVHEAGSVDEALEVIRKEHVDVVVLDMKMPDDIAGLRLLKAAFHFGIIKHSVPIIVFTAYQDYDNCVQAIKSGAYDYILKGNAKQNTIRLLVNKCVAAIEDSRRPSIPIGEDWLTKNYAYLRKKYGGKRIAVLSVDLAKQCGITEGDMIDNRWVFSADSFEQLRDNLLKYPEVRDSQPFMALVPEEEIK